MPQDKNENGQEKQEKREEVIPRKSSVTQKINNLLIKFQPVPLSQKLFLTKNLGVMVKSGLSLSVALRALSAQTPNKRLKLVLDEVCQDVEKGVPFYKSLEKHPKIFSEVFRNMIRAGEKSGNLEGVLKQLAIQLKKTHELISKIKGALTYPIFVILAMLGIGILMMTFVVPKVIDVFSQFDTELPLATRILIFTSNFLTNNGLLVIAGFIILVGVFIKIIRTKKGKFYLHVALLKFPMLSSIIKKINLAKFCRTFSSLLATDIPIVETIQITATVLGNQIYRKYLLEISDEVKKGKSLAQLLKRDEKLFPPVLTQMVMVGEETGTLDNILEDLAQFYENDVSQTMEGLSSIIEPVLIIILGAGVAGMAVAVIMPMYTLSQQF